MKVRCKANSGMSFSEDTIKAWGIYKTTKFPLKVNEIYVVYGQMLLKKGGLEYLIKGTYENLPSWYPAGLFEVVDNLMPFEMYFQYCEDDEIISAVWGFEELVKDKMYIEDLVEREEEAVLTFLRRKKEIDEFLEFDVKEW